MRRTQQHRPAAIRCAVVAAIVGCHFDMKKEIIVILILIITGCEVGPSYRNVGDIAFDESIDSADFELCNELRIKQYYARGSKGTPANYVGEMKALYNEFYEQYNHPVSEDEDGYVIIRFIVNCRGKSGRFRIQEMDSDYRPKEFNSEIISQLLTVTKELDGWIPVIEDSTKFDFYQYLTFKLENGQLVDILP